jgi:hypothetical protein
MDVQPLLEILKVSDYWQINDLKNVVEEALVPHITHNTFSDSELISDGIRFI